MEPEIVICAAVIEEDGTIIRGHRHSDCFRTIWERKKKHRPNHDAQGFITSKNRYVNRKEGYEIQKAAGIESIDKELPFHGGELYSEDLY